MSLPMLAPIIKGAVTGALSGIIPGNMSQTAVADSVVAAVVKKVTEDPVLKNAMNQEKPIQSRIAVGSVVAALGVLAPAAASLFGFNITENETVRLLDSVVVLWGVGYSLYGRFWPGLKPLGSKS